MNHAAEPDHSGEVGTDRLVLGTNQILAVLLLYFVVLGGISAYQEAHRIAEPPWSAVLLSVVGSILVFWWYWTDSTLRSYRRSPLLNVAVIAVGFLAVPYYLVRTRKKGQRLLAVAKMIGFMVLTIVAVMIGALPVVLLS